jgi:hypothetical protein
MKLLAVAAACVALCVSVPVKADEVPKMPEPRLTMLPMATIDADEAVTLLKKLFPTETVIVRVPLMSAIAVVATDAELRTIRAVLRPF